MIDINVLYVADQNIQTILDNFAKYLKDKEIISKLP